MPAFGFFKDREHVVGSHCELSNPMPADYASCASSAFCRPRISGIYFRNSSSPLFSPIVGGIIFSFVGEFGD